MRNAKYLYRIFVIIALYLFSAAISFAVSVPNIIHYSGSLTDKSGAVVANGQYKVTFSMYSSRTSSAPLWSEKWGDSATVPSTTPITVIDGGFNAMLGSIKPIPDSFFADYPKLFFGITVGNDSEMTPRQQLASVGYSFSAGNGIPKGGIIMWSGATNQIPVGWTLCDGTNNSPDLRDRFIVSIGSSYAVGATGGEDTHTLTINEMPTHTHVQDAHNHAQNPHNHINGVYSALLKYDGAGTNSGTDSTAGEPNLKSYGTMLSATAINLSSTATNQNSGLGQPHENRPRYYALAFIMKL